MKMIDRIRKFQERAREQNANRNYSDEENIFFDLSEGTHQVRLIGDFVSVHTHWIGPSKYSRVELYDEDAFQGNDRLKRSVNCPDFDIDTETPALEKSCTICRIRAVANDLLCDCEGLDFRQRKWLEDIAYCCQPAERNFFLCIDRDNPEIAPGRKGYKIIELPRPLMEQWVQLVENNAELDVNSVEEGVDFTITKKKGDRRNEYTINYSMNGAVVRQTPLTEEEKAYAPLDIRKIMGKMPDQDALCARLLPELRELLGDTGEDAATGDLDEEVPF